MSSYRIYSRKTMGLDNRVWFVISGAFLLLGVFFTYRVFNPVTCTAFLITIKKVNSFGDTAIRKGESIHFSASINNENILWDFGDNTDRDQGKIVVHRYSTDGPFYVKAFLNSKCMSPVQTVMVVKDEIKVILPPVILGRDSSETGKEMIFICPDTASSYDWVVKDRPEIVNTGGKGPIAKYKFPLLGNYTVMVTLNGDKTKTGVKSVIVKLKTEPNKLLPPPPPPPCASPLSNEDFSNLLVKVMNMELESENFSQFLCRGDNTVVSVNNGKQEFKFGEFCHKISAINPENKQKIKITVLQSERADEKIKGVTVKGVVKKVLIKLEISKKKGFIFKKSDLRDYKL